MMALKKTQANKRNPTYPPRKIPLGSPSQQLHFLWCSFPVFCSHNFKQSPRSPMFDTLFSFVLKVPRESNSTFINKSLRIKFFATTLPNFFLVITTDEISEASNCLFSEVSDRLPACKGALKDLLSGMVLCKQFFFLPPLIRDSFNR